MTTITLAGVALSGTGASMQWTNRFTEQTIVQSTRRTIGGKQVINSAANINGRSIILEARQDTGWLLKSEVDALMASAAVNGASYSFDYHGIESYTVVFDYTSGPAIEMRPLTPKVPLLDTDYFIGTIKLLTV